MSMLSWRDRWWRGSRRLGRRFAQSGISGKEEASGGWRGRTPASPRFSGVIPELRWSSIPAISALDRPRWCRPVGGPTSSHSTAPARPGNSVATWAQTKLSGTSGSALPSPIRTQGWCSSCRSQSGLGTGPSSLRAGAPGVEVMGDKPPACPFNTRDESVVEPSTDTAVRNP